MTVRPRVLLAVDRPGWAFAHIAEQITRHLSDEFDFTTAPYHEVTARSRGAFDIVVAFWWGSALRLRGDLRPERQVCCVYDHYSWVATEYATKHAGLSGRQSTDIAVANDVLATTFPNPHSRPVHVVEDGVDTKLFTPQPFPATFTAGWVGNSVGPKGADGPVDLKGMEMLRAACAAADVPLVTRDLKDGLWPHEQMPSFYRDCSVILCGSSAEGTPNPVLEAMACGRPVISTAVGIVPKLVIYAENGLIVGRNVDAFAKALMCMRRASEVPAELCLMSCAAREAAERHDWAIKIEAWRECLRKAA